MQYVLYCVTCCKLCNMLHKCNTISATSLKEHLCVWCFVCIIWLDFTASVIRTNSDESANLTWTWLGWLDFLGKCLWQWLINFILNPLIADVHRWQRIHVPIDSAWSFHTQDTLSRVCTYLPYSTNVARSMLFLFSTSCNILPWTFSMSF